MRYCTNAPIAPYWSITKCNDIVHVETNPAIFSSDMTLGGISIRDTPPGYELPSFITTDEPRHSAQRKTSIGRDRMTALRPPLDGSGEC